MGAYYITWNQSANDALTYARDLHPVIEANPVINSGRPSELS
jgi:hypothetical protein